MSDWTTALVVRDRLGRLRHADGFLDEPITSGLDPLEIAAFADTFGPMEPILDHGGHPIVCTVGDLTARHIGKRVRVGDGAGAIEGRLRTNWSTAPDGTLTLWWSGHPGIDPVDPVVLDANAAELVWGLVKTMREDYDREQRQQADEKGGPDLGWIADDLDRTAAMIHQHAREIREAS